MEDKNLENRQPDKFLRTDLKKMRDFPDGTSSDKIPKKEYTPEEWSTEVKKIEEISREESEKEWTSPISIEELCKKEFPPIPWVVEGMFARKTINQISAPPNQWKTWTALHVGISIAKGEKVFCHFNTEQQGVMIVNEEDPDYLLQGRFKMLLDQTDKLPIYIHIEKGIKLDDETTDKLIDDMKNNNCSIVIFDSLSVIHNANENDATEMNAVFNQMKKFAREGFTVIFTNHHRK